MVCLLVKHNIETLAGLDTLSREYVSVLLIDYALHYVLTDLVWSLEVPPVFACGLSIVCAATLQAFYGADGQGNAVREGGGGGHVDAHHQDPCLCHLRNPGAS